MNTLKNVAVGKRAKVIKLHGEGALKRKVAPLGDPIQVTLRGYELSLRKSDADQIEVELI